MLATQTIMYASTSVKSCLKTITLVGFVLASIPTLPLKAQTVTPQADLLEGIQAGEEVDWSFSSENETRSIKDDLQELGEYSLSESDSDIELTGETPAKWGNGGDVEDRSIGVEVYDY